MRTLTAVGVANLVSKCLHSSTEALGKTVIRGPLDNATDPIVSCESLFYLSQTDLNLAVAHLESGRFGLCANESITGGEQVLAKLQNRALKFLNLSLVFCGGHPYKLVERAAVLGRTDPSSTT